MRPERRKPRPRERIRARSDRSKPFPAVPNPSQALMLPRPSLSVPRRTFAIKSFKSVTRSQQLLPYRRDRTDKTPQSVTKTIRYRCAAASKAVRPLHNGHKEQRDRRRTITGQAARHTRGISLICDRGISRAINRLVGERQLFGDPASFCEVCSD